MNLSTPCIASIAITSTLALAGMPDVSIFDTRNDFNLAAGDAPLTTETFESEALDDINFPTAFDSGLNASFAAGSVTTFVGAGDPTNNGFGNSTANGRNYLAFGRTYEATLRGATYDMGDFSVEYTFGTIANAFAFDLSGVDFFLGTTDGFGITTLNNGQVMDEIFFESEQFFDLTFYGFVSANAFDTVRVHIDSNNMAGVADYAAFDDVTWGAVPAPSAASLLALSGLVASRRRR